MSINQINDHYQALMMIIKLSMRKLTAASQDHPEQYFFLSSKMKHLRPKCTVECKKICNVFFISEMTPFPPLDFFQKNIRIGDRRHSKRRSCSMVEECYHGTGTITTQLPRPAVVSAAGCTTPPVSRHKVHNMVKAYFYAFYTSYVNTIPMYFCINFFQSHKLMPPTYSP